MWLFTNFGFFSIVEKPADRDRDTLTVRARFAGDLETLRERYLPDLGLIAEDAGTDYKYRACAPRAAVAAAFQHALLDLDYHNFKSAVLKRQGYSRADLYGGIWGLLYEAQSRDEARAAAVGD